MKNAKDKELIKPEGDKLTQNEQIQNALMEVVKNPEIDPVRLEKFLDLQIKMEDRQNLQAFNDSFAKFQEECPIIPKTKKVAFGKVDYSYAPLDEMVYLIKPIMGKNGLSFSFNLASEDSMMILTTIISHKNGCTKDFQYFFNPLHDDARMNDSQRRKSAITFAKRSALENALGIVTAECDDDARRAIDNPITNEQLETINSLMKTTDTTEASLLNYLKVENLGLLNATEAKKTINSLNAKRSSLIKKGGENV